MRTNGLPTFAIFTPDCPNCVFSSEEGPKEPSFMKRLNKSFYADVTKILVEQRGLNYHRDYKEVTIKACFSGIIPERVRRKINDVTHLFDEILLLAEIEEWSVTKVALPPDPLVVGVLHSYLYLIDQFDTTKAENYIAKEFTS